MTEATFSPRRIKLIIQFIAMMALVLACLVVIVWMTYDRTFNRRVYYIELPREATEKPEFD